MSLLVALYGAVVSARNHLYDGRVLPARKLAGQVVSVGNISAGGAGKTPFVILLGGLLQRRGVAFDVLSRGYGRKTKGVLLVDGNGSAEEFGDEPLLIARRLGCPVIVGESRYRAGLWAESKFGPQLHLLDDGFQHRSLARDFNIVLLTPEDVKDSLLPKGRLREPLQSLTRADVVVVNSEFDVSLLPVPHGAVWRIRRDLEMASSFRRPVVFCGIARPGKFLEQLRRKGIGPVGEKFYPDHHAYSNSDVEDLLRLKTQNGADGFITTEKDAVNLKSDLSRLDPVEVARVTMEIVEPADAIDSMLRRIDPRKERA
ncbi:MAG TPA: tetraacyldisaccharide 4'-kinase [Terriglobales bacterium]|nr:tetraacyldisaccharide 4'-kinase [Terriglobales bacterium]